ncbi:MAG: porin family protein, partial [Gammaproteobacteria bacterium]|nr:porin family protein [Gammaproteobacteria bacterium]
SAGVGWDYAKRVTFDSNNALLELDRGLYLPIAAIGTSVGDSWRVELDGSILENTPEILYSASAGIELDSDPGDLIEAKNLMFNVLRDVPVGIAWRPYFGAGIGMSKLSYRFSELELDTPVRQRPRRDIVNDDTTTFAFQFIAGFTVPITRRFDLAADYRYWHAPSPDLEDVDGNDLGVDHTVHSAWLQLRYHAPNAGVFKAPPPRRKTMSGFYVESTIGGGFSEDSDVRDTVIGLDAFDLGPVATAAVGYAWRKRWRFELEGQYRNNEVEVVDFRLVQGEDPADGHVKNYSVMANIIYQFAPGSSIRPFIGAGYGIAHATFDVDVFGICEFFVCGAERTAKLIDDDDSTDALQIMAGVDVALSPRTTFTADYRYWRTSDFKMQQPDGAPFDAYLRNTSITVGVRYSFGADH